MTIPPLRQDITLITEGTEADGSPAWLLHDRPRNRFFRLGWVESAMLRRWQGVDSIEQLVNQINQETTLTITYSQVTKFIAFLKENQLILPPSSLGKGGHDCFRAEREKSTGSLEWLLHRYLFFSIPLLRPDKILAHILKKLPWIVYPSFLIFAMLSGLLGLYLVSRQWDLFLTTLPQLFSWQGVVMLALAIFIAKTVHELGHALLAKQYGCRVSTMGVAFLVMWPVLYVDTSDVWRLPSREKRLKVVAAGMVAELALAGVATLLWNFSSDGALKSALLALATVTWVTALIINGNPLMRFDGYFFLSDWLEIANLQERCFALGRWQLRRVLFGLPDGPPEQFSPPRQKFLIFFAWAVWLYRFFLFLGIALLVYHFFFKVLGLFLMVVEIEWFILKPIRRELGYWIKNRSRIHRGSVSRLALLFLTLTALLLIPWQGHIILPAVLHAQTFITLYPPIAARVVQVHAHEGMMVSQGDRLFTLESPDLEQKLALNRLDRERFLYESQRPGIDTNHREQRLVAVQQLASAQAEYQGIRALKQQLDITAPFAGILVQLAEGLTAGRWLAQDQPLAYLYHADKKYIRAYVDENRLQQVTVGERGTFFAKDPSLPLLPVRVVEKDHAAITHLEWPYLASVYEGPLPVRREHNTETLFPEEALYRIHLALERPLRLKPEAILLGEVSLPGKKESIAKKIWLETWAVFVRESGF